jgi:hypothetical protein
VSRIDFLRSKIQGVTDDSNMFSVFNTREIVQGTKIVSSIQPTNLGSENVKIGENMLFGNKKTFKNINF